MQEEPLRLARLVLQERIVLQQVQLSYLNALPALPRPILFSELRLARLVLQERIVLRQVPRF